MGIFSSSSGTLSLRQPAASYKIERNVKTMAPLYIFMCKTQKSE